MGLLVGGEFEIVGGTHPNRTNMTVFQNFMYYLLIFIISAVKNSNFLLKGKSIEIELTR